MICKIFIRTFPSVEECDMFEAILQTKWPTLLGDKEAKGVTKGTTFSAYRNKEAPHVSTVVWQFPDMSTQKTIEALIEKHIRKFTQTLSPKTMTFTGDQTVSLQV